MKLESDVMNLQPKGCPLHAIVIIINRITIIIIIMKFLQRHMVVTSEAPAAGWINV